MGSRLSLVRLIDRLSVLLHIANAATLLVPPAQGDSFALHPVHPALPQPPRESFRRISQVELFGPEQPNPPGLEVIQQGQLPVVPLGPLFEEQRADGEDSGEADLG